jgi:uncharacterized caspase-like protein
VPTPQDVVGVVAHDSAAHKRSWRARGVNYLIPSDVPSVTPDAEARVRGASIAETDVIAELQTKGERVALLVLDACRDNPFPRSATRSIGNTRGLNESTPARGIFTIYSAGIGQTALDRLEPNDRSPNSVFTRVFVEELTQPGVDVGGLAIETASWNVIQFFSRRMCSG